MGQIDFFFLLACSGHSDLHSAQGWDPICFNQENKISNVRHYSYHSSLFYTPIMLCLIVDCRGIVLA